MPLWQVRQGADVLCGNKLDWDILAADPPDISACQGIIALAGATNGNLGLNTDLALAAIELAQRSDCGSVLLTSSAAVYGPSASAMAEDADCDPANDYGRAKLTMEQVVTSHVRDLGDTAPLVCILRIGNVGGADALLLAAGRGAVVLDQFDDGQGPERSYIGILSLARIMTQLIALARQFKALPAILNIAAPRPILMTVMLQAAGVKWDWQPAPAHAMRRMVLDTTRLDTLISPAPLSDDPAEIVRQARCGGWVPK